MDSPLMHSFTSASKPRSPDVPLLPLYTSHYHLPSLPSRPPSASRSTASIHLHPPPLITGPRTTDTTVALQALARQAAHLQNNLQELLDAQGTGLLEGLGRGDGTYIERGFGVGSGQDGSRSRSRSRSGPRTPTTANTVSVAGSTTSAYTSTKARRRREGAIVVPVRQPRPRGPVGLRASRRGIMKTMEELADIKDTEGQTLDLEVGKRKAILGEIKALEEKRAGLVRRITAIENEDSTENIGTPIGDFGARQSSPSRSLHAGGGTKRLRDMQAEEQNLTTSITETENRLWELKARRGTLRRAIETLENQVQSRLSSYKEALNILDQDIKSRFLATRPLSLSGDTTDRKTRQEVSVWTLPPERRTLQLAKESIESSHASLLQHRTNAEEERSALEEGVEMWHSVVQAVARVESLLKDEVGRISDQVEQVQEQEQEQEQEDPLNSIPSRIPSFSTADESSVFSNSLNSGGPKTNPILGTGDPRNITTTTSSSSPLSSPSADPPAAAATARMQHILKQISHTITFLDDRLAHAESRSWNLLVCCVGAELEALREGREMLRGVVVRSTEGDGFGGGRGGGGGGGGGAGVGFGDGDGDGSKGRGRGMGDGRSRTEGGAGGEFGGAEGREGGETQALVDVGVGVGQGEGAAEGARERDDGVNDDDEEGDGDEEPGPEFFGLVYE